MKEFEASSTTYAKQKCYHVMLWWKIPSLIPKSTRDFCLLKYDCKFKKNNEYFLKITRTKIKSKSNSELNVENTIRINKEIYESIKDYKRSIPSNLLGEYLFSYQIQMRFFTRKNYKRRKDILPTDKLSFLLSKYYKEILKWDKKDFVKVKKNDREEIGRAHV